MSKKNKRNLALSPKTVTVLSHRHSSLRSAPLPVRFVGEELRREVEMRRDRTLEQVQIVARLPHTVAVSLMPDAHEGYGMPIGGVAVTRDVVYPFAVGVDIACRMRLTVFKFAPENVDRREVLEAIRRSTRFGKGAAFEKPQEHPVMDDPLWHENSILRSLYPRALQQLGTLGAGNHFADLIALRFVDDEVAGRWGKALGLETEREYVGLLTHGGSRWAGNRFANTYIALAEAVAEVEFGQKPPKGYGWLWLDTEEGEAYWRGMNLLGQYAHANHLLTHRNFAREMGWEGEVITVVENHHNFAWEMGAAEVEVLGLEPGHRYFIHRKGATPAGKGVLGVIPGSSGSASFVVEGLGNAEFLFSASHGAGRRFSRRKAREEFQRAHADEFSRYMAERGIIYEGVDEDETVWAYKDIEDVIRAQTGLGLIRPVLRLRNLVVKMGGKAAAVGK